MQVVDEALSKLTFFDAGKVLCDAAETLPLGILFFSTH
jgi:hypothetical protein